MLQSIYDYIYFAGKEIGSGKVSDFSKFILLARHVSAWFNTPSILNKLSGFYKWQDMWPNVYEADAECS